MRYLLYSRPILKDLSLESKMRFIRIFRHLSPDNVSDNFAIIGENKRRIKISIFSYYISR